MIIWHTRFKSKLCFVAEGPRSTLTVPLVKMLERNFWESVSHSLSSYSPLRGSPSAPVSSCQSVVLKKMLRRHETPYSPERLKIYVLNDLHELKERRPKPILFSIGETSGSDISGLHKTFSSHADSRWVQRFHGFSCTHIRLY